MVLSKVSISTLTAIAGGLGIGVGVMLYMLRQQQNEFATKGVFVKTAVNILDNQPQVDDLLGKPYKLGRANLQDGWSKLQQDYVQVRLPVTGQKDKAIMWAYAKRMEDNKIKLFKLEMTFDKQPGKKMILMDGEEATINNQEGTKS